MQFHQPMFTPFRVLLLFVGSSLLFESAHGNDSSKPVDRPNILWIYVDDMSDWLSCYGDKVIKTPEIDALADGGVRFTNAFMPSPVCSTTRSAIITGQSQTSLGLHHHRTMIKEKLPDTIRTVPELFRQAGYITFNEAKEDYNFVRDRRLLYSSEFKRPKVKAHFVGGDLTWLEQLQGKPFFGQIQLKGGKIGGETGSRYPAKSRIDASRVEVPPQYPDDQVFRNAIARHYEQILQTDETVGEIVSGLKQYDLWDNTIVFFFTDHGSPLPRSKQFLYHEGVKVPLIVRMPDKYQNVEFKTGMVRSDLVSGIDMGASSLGLAKIPLPDNFEGKQLFAADFQPRQYVVCARDRCGIAVDRIRSVSTCEFHYIRNYKTDRALFQSNYRDQYATFKRFRELADLGQLTELQKSFADASVRPAEELYSVKADPHQVKNLAGLKEYRSQLELHRAYLADWEKQTGDQGRRPESRESLRRVFEVAKGKVAAPEFEFLREGSRPKKDK